MLECQNVVFSVGVKKILLALTLALMRVIGIVWLRRSMVILKS